MIANATQRQFSTPNNGQSHATSYTQHQAGRLQDAKRHYLGVSAHESPIQ